MIDNCLPKRGKKFSITSSHVSFLDQSFDREVVWSKLLSSGFLRYTLLKCLWNCLLCCQGADCWLSDWFHWHNSFQLVRMHATGFLVGKRQSVESFISQILDVTIRCWGISFAFSLNLLRISETEDLELFCIIGVSFLLFFGGVEPSSLLSSELLASSCWLLMQLIWPRTQSLYKLYKFLVLISLVTFTKRTTPMVWYSQLLNFTFTLNSQLHFKVHVFIDNYVIKLPRSYM